MCPLQNINDIEPLSLTIHGVNASFIHHPSNVENYLIGHKLETVWPKNKTKKVVLKKYFYTFLLVLESNFKIQVAKNCHWTFLTCRKSAPNGPANGPAVTYSKIQNRLSRAPYATPMDRFLMQYLNNKCTLTLHKSLQKLYLTWQPVAPP